MLYGEVPWKIMNTLTKFNLDQVIEKVINEDLLFVDDLDSNKIKLLDCFNEKQIPMFQQTRVSEETKGLIKQMLQIEEEDRIDWQELFYLCESIKQKIDIGINTVNENTNKQYLKKIRQGQNSQLIDLDNSKMKINEEEEQNILEIIKLLDL